MAEEEADLEAMKRFDVRLGVRPWKGAYQVPADEALAIVVNEVAVNGDIVYGLLPGETDMKVWLDLDPFMLLHLEGLSDRAWDAIGATEDDWAEESTRDHLILHVRSLVIEELPAWQDKHDRSD